MINYPLLASIAIGLGFLVGKGTHLLRITGVVGYIVTGIIIGHDVLGIIQLTPNEAYMNSDFVIFRRKCK